MPERVTEYVDGVLSGEIVAGPHVRAACRRHLKDLERSDIFFDHDAVSRIFNFFERILKLSEGQFENKPFVLHLSQCFILGSLFGWMKPGSDGPVRRFRRAYIEQGKGNGKSPLVGGIGLYGMTADKEPGAQIFAAGATRDQAGILFRDAVNMAHKAPALDRRIVFSGNLKVFKMTVSANGSTFEPLSRQAGRTGSGPRPHMALCDEVHEHTDRGVMELLERGFKFRRQPLLVMITNSGTDRNSICWEEHEHAVAVVHGEIEDDDEFSYVCALDDDDDPLEDEVCWEKANPLLGVTITREYLAGVVKQAKQIPGKRNAIFRLHFCIWTDAEKAWLPREVWEACEDETLDLNDFKGKVCNIGLDLAQTRDLAARVQVFEDGFVETEDGKQLPKFAVFAWGYTPRETLRDRVEADRAPYDQWVDKGFLTATPGPVIRLDQIALDCARDCQDFSVQNIAYDSYLYRRFEDACRDLGVELPAIEHPQGVSRRQSTELFMPESINQLEELILQRRIRFHVNPALRSAVANATFWTSPAGLRRFEKMKASGKIDLLVGLAMGVGAAMLPFREGETSVFEALAKARKAEKLAVVKPGEIDYKALNDPKHPGHKFALKLYHKQLENDDLD